jgi:dTDP-L-rhamnose 4-epimerase
MQTRDLTHVSDIVQANLLAMERQEMDYHAFNVGTGRALTVLDVAQSLIEHLDSIQTPQIVHEYRAGDIRHCFADISRIEAVGYRPGVRFEESIAELAEWLRAQTAVDGFERARQELVRRGLTT